MTTIGYATLQIIPSLDGVSKSIDKQLDGKMLASGTRGGKQLAKGFGAGLKDLERDVDSAAKAYGRLKDKAADALGKVRSDEAALQRLRDTGASSDRIIKAEERLATSRRNSTRANRDAEDSHKSLLAAQKAVGDGSDNLGRKFSGLSGFAGVAGDAIAAAGVVAAGAAVVGIGALAVGVAAAGRALYDLGAQFDDVFDNIRIKTGATGPALDQLEKATERLATKVPLSIGEIGNVVAETSRALHLTGPDLDNVARSIANLGRLTGENVDIRTLGKAFRGFGVDAKDQVPALDALFRASQSTGVGVNELLATVVKGGAGLRQFGFDFGQSAALITQFEEAGLDADKAMAGITKGLAALAKDGKTGQQALKDTVGEIKNLIAVGDSASDAKALDLTNKLFGAKGGAQFFEAIKNGALDLDTLADSISNTGDTIDQAAKDTDDWSQRWQTFKNQIAVGLQPIATTVFDTINDKLTNLADFAANHQPELIDFFGRIGQAALDFAGDVGKAAALSLKGFGDLTSSFGDLLSTLGDLSGPLQGIPDAILTGIPVVGTYLTSIKHLGDSTSTTAQSLQDAGKKMSGLGDEMSAAIDKNIPKAKSWFDETIKRTADATRFTQALGDATASVPDGKTIELSSNSPEVIEGLKRLGIEVVNLPNGKIGVTANTEEGMRIIDAFRSQETRAPIEVPATVNLGKAQSAIDIWKQQLASGPGVQIPVSAAPPGYNPLLPAGPADQPRRASGGPIFGPGGARSDSIPIWASNGEHMWTSAEVDAVGGQANMYRLRALALKGAFRGFAGGGDIWAVANVAPGGDLFGSGGQRTRRRIIWWGGPNDPAIGHTPDVPQDILPIPGKPGQDPPNIFGGSPGEWPPNNNFPVPGDPRWIWRHNRRGVSGLGAALGFKDGGAIGPDVQAAGDLVGTPYDKASRHDCSGMPARVIDRTLGLPETDLMSTKNAAQWLAARGFVPGIGGPGQISVGWYDHGPNPNDGHMAMTLSDGSHAEAGGRAGSLFQIGGAAAGADDPQFDQHMYLPTVYGEGPAGSSSASPFAEGSAAAAATGPTPSTSSSAPSSSSGGGAGVSLPSSISGLSSFALDSLGSGVGKTSSGTDLGLFGKAAGAAVSGQVSSALGVLGVNDTPGWLKGISQFVSGIRVSDASGNTLFDGSNLFGGGGGRSAWPLAADSAGAGTPAPDDSGNMHGNRAGQAPGPVYNITARDTEDAFVKAQRVEREKAAAKLSRY